MHELAQAIQKRLDSINFTELWPGFHPFPFALYNDQNALIKGKEISKPDDFLGNTALLYQEELYVIWKIDDLNVRMNIDILTSKIVHEMFHAFQQEKHDQRFPSEIKALRYTYDCVNLSMKYVERERIQRLLKTFNETQLHELLASLQYRKEHFPFEFSYESKIETIEGMAQYVELLSLKQLNITLYQEKIFNMLQYIKKIENYQKIRFLCYDFGTLLLLIIAENSLDFDYSLDCEKTIAEQLLDHFTEAKYKPYCKLEFKELVQNIYRERVDTIERILSDSSEPKQLNHTLYGFDPLNTFLHDQYIYCKNFAGIKDEEMVWLRGEMLFKIDQDNQLKMLYTKKSDN